MIIPQIDCIGQILRVFSPYVSLVYNLGLAYYLQQVGTLVYDYNRGWSLLTMIIHCYREWDIHNVQ